MNDLYSDLGVNLNASKEQIKDAYKKLAKESHPDKPTGDTEKFQSVQRAYSILGDDEKRSRYDSTGQTSKPSFESVLSGYISGILQEIINSGKEVDIIDFLKQVTKEQLLQMVKNLKALDKKEEHLNKLSESIKIKKGQDYITPIFQENVRMVKSQIIIQLEQKETTEKILEVLEGYDYEYTPAFVTTEHVHTVYFGF